MTKSVEMLEVVNEQDIVIGLESRSMIHQKGLLHREIHIWFITPEGEIIFQHRAKTKDTYPDKLDATVGGGTLSLICHTRKLLLRNAKKKQE